jgi:membrane-bound lytic murein transglycosylase D
VAWTAIAPGRPVSLGVIAAETGADINVLRRLNLELLHGITPPDPFREVVVPVSHAQQVAALFQRNDIALLRYHHYRIQPGDTLSALSRHYGVSLAMIEQHNPGIRNRVLRIGEIVIIPVLTETEPFVRQPVALSRPFSGTHVVSQGETLWSLSRRFGVSLQELAMANNMDINQTLSIGRSLNVPIIE